MFPRSVLPLLLIAFFTGLAGLPAQDASTPPAAGTVDPAGTPDPVEDADPQEESEPEAPPKKKEKPRLEPWMKQQILDKPRIAKDTQRRLVGLREAGNPHVIEGSALKDARYPAPMDEAQRDAMRERQLDVHQRGRQIDWGLPEGVEPEQAPTIAPTADRSEESGFPWANIFAMGAAGLALFFVLHRVRRDALGE